MVERNLAKVEVESSRLFCRSRFKRGKDFPLFRFSPLAGWQSGHAAACKAVYAGSIPTPASRFQSLLTYRKRLRACEGKVLA